MADRNSQTRRRWLGTCTGVTASTVLAGCFGSDDDTGDENGNGNGNRNGTGNGDTGIDRINPEEESLGEDWPMYGVDLQNTGHQPDATGPEGDELITREIIDLGGITTRPAIIVDETVYISSIEGSTYAIDSEEEQILWEREGYGELVARDGMVYGPTDGSQIYGYDLETGDEWVPEEIKSANSVWGPVPLDERLFVASPEDSIWKINIETGNYSTFVEIDPGFGVTDMPAYQNGMCYLGRSSKLYGINVDTSEIEWTFETENEGRLSDSNPAVSNGMVYLTSRDRKLHAVETDSGDEAWTVDTGVIETSPAVADGLVYTAERDQVIAVDAREGEVEWQREDAIIGEPEDIAIADGVCYVTTRNGISAYDAASGNLKWEHDVSDDDDIRFNAPPAIFHGTIYLPSRDETLYAIEDA